MFWREESREENDSSWTDVLAEPSSPVTPTTNNCISQTKKSITVKHLKEEEKKNKHSKGRGKGSVNSKDKEVDCEVIDDKLFQKSTRTNKRSRSKAIMQRPLRFNPLQRDQVLGFVSRALQATEDGAQAGVDEEGATASPSSSSSARDLVLPEGSAATLIETGIPFEIAVDNTPKRPALETNCLPSPQVSAATSRRRRDTLYNHNNNSGRRRVSCSPSRRDRSVERHSNHRDEGHGHHTKNNNTTSRNDAALDVSLRVSDLWCENGPVSGTTQGGTQNQKTSSSGGVAANDRSSDLTMSFGSFNKSSNGNNNGNHKSSSSWKNGSVSSFRRIRSLPPATPSVDATSGRLSIPRPNRKNSSEHTRTTSNHNPKQAGASKLNHTEEEIINKVTGSKSASGQESPPDEEGNEENEQVEAKDPETEQQDPIPGKRAVRRSRSRTRSSSPSPRRKKNNTSGTSLDLTARQHRSSRPSNAKASTGTEDAPTNRRRRSESKSTSPRRTQDGDKSQSSRRRSQSREASRGRSCGITASASNTSTSQSFEVLRKRYAGVVSADKNDDDDDNSSNAESKPNALPSSTAAATTTQHQRVSPSRRTTTHRRSRSKDTSTHTERSNKSDESGSKKKRILSGSKSHGDLDTAATSNLKPSSSLSKLNSKKIMSSQRRSRSKERSTHSEGRSSKNAVMNVTAVVDDSNSSPIKAVMSRHRSSNNRPKGPFLSGTSHERAIHTTPKTSKKTTGLKVAADRPSAAATVTTTPGSSASCKRVVRRRVSRDPNNFYPKSLKSSDIDTDTVAATTKSLRKSISINRHDTFRHRGADVEEKVTKKDKTKPIPSSSSNKAAKSNSSTKKSTNDEDIFEDISVKKVKRGSSSKGKDRISVKDLAEQFQHSFNELNWDTDDDEDDEGEGWDESSHGKSQHVVTRLGNKEKSSSTTHDNDDIKCGLKKRPSLSLSVHSRCKYPGTPVPPGALDDSSVYDDDEDDGFNIITSPSVHEWSRMTTEAPNENNAGGILTSAAPRMSITTTPRPATPSAPGRSLSVFSTTSAGSTAMTPTSSVSRTPLAGARISRKISRSKSPKESSSRHSRKNSSSSSKNFPRVDSSGSVSTYSRSHHSTGAGSHSSNSNSKVNLSSILKVASKKKKKLSKDSQAVLDSLVAPSKLAEWEVQERRQHGQKQKQADVFHPSFHGDDDNEDDGGESIPSVPDTAIYGKNGVLLSSSPKTGRRRFADATSSTTLISKSSSCGGGTATTATTTASSSTTSTAPYVLTEKALAKHSRAKQARRSSILSSMSKYLDEEDDDDDDDDDDDKEIEELFKARENHHHYDNENNNENYEQQQQQQQRIIRRGQKKRQSITSITSTSSSTGTSNKKNHHPSSSSKKQISTKSNDNFVARTYLRGRK